MACPGVYLAALQMAQPVQAEFLDGKAPHDRSVDHGAAERSVGLVPVPGQVAHEATGEAVARPGRIVWLFKRKCWDTENATLEEPHDPTGAGDSFAGGFMGYLAGAGSTNDSALRRAMVYGSVLGSFTVERFGLERLLKLKKPEIHARARRFSKLTQFKL